MTGAAADDDAEPFESAFDREDLEAGRFDDDGGVGAVAVLDGLGGAGTAGLFVDDAFEEDVAFEADTGALDRLDGGDHGGDTALHIDGAATPDLAVGDLGAEGWTGPGGGIATGDDVDVAVEDEGAAALAAGAFEGADDVGAAGIDVPAVDAAAEGCAVWASMMSWQSDSAPASPLGEFRVLGGDADHPLQEVDRGWFQGGGFLREAGDEFGGACGCPFLGGGRIAASR